MSFIEDYYRTDVAERALPETSFYLSWLDHVRGERILNLGCGPTFYDDITFFGEIPREVVGIDRSVNNLLFLNSSHHPQILKAKGFAQEHDITTRLIAGSILDPHPGFVGHFDAACAVGVIGMFSDSDVSSLLTLVRGYLKPGGVLVDIDWTEHHLPLQVYEQRRRCGWYSEENTPSIERIGSIMREAGFVLEQHEVYDVPNKEEYLWGKVYGYLARRPLAV